MRRAHAASLLAVGLGRYTIEHKSGEVPFGATSSNVASVMLLRQ